MRQRLCLIDGAADWAYTSPGVTLHQQLRTHGESSVVKAILLGIVASLFFATTFVLNRAMELGGGSWIWSAALRYFFMVVPLVALVLWRGNLRPLFAEMRARPLAWLVWSTVGFGIFYAPICFAAAYQPGWLVASSWQITIIAGALLTPLLTPAAAGTMGAAPPRHTLPLASIAVSLLIIGGVVITQFEHMTTDMRQLGTQGLVLGLLPVLVAAFAYPLGNRKMMALCGGRLDTFQRVLGMTLASLPFWLLLAAYGVNRVGWPSTAQLGQSLVVALCSGVIATLLFFKATDLAQAEPRQLAAVEATQSGEVIFAIVGEMLLLHTLLPSGAALFGVGCIVIGMMLHSFIAHQARLRPAALAIEAGQPISVIQE